MHYEGNVIRPPSEADSILLQATVGCTHNKCAFCGAYPRERFRIKDEAQVFEDIDFAARHMTRQRRLFLLSGDALTMPQARLERILTRVRERLPWVARVSSYANARGLKNKTSGDLERLRERGLAAVYMGLESGDDEVLARMNKKATLEDMLREARKVRQAGLKLCVTVLAGLGGAEGWRRHARLTGRALTLMEPDQAASLSVIPVPGTPLWEDVRAGRFTLPDGPGMVRELRELLAHADMRRGLFLADHASNHVPLKLRMPRDKQHGLDLLDAALDGSLPLKPERARRL
ncbi:radical SAM protein [Fundidesulfovibrio agrisoli]|uniref:radical SAM protein n=1 Tax=Fundidesulfovibrio agrisoli TaxID=2922717 RepID=UPI001FAE0614|nr:radical SAM protein [Fundidesulfovibrio agrisoli]